MDPEPHPIEPVTTPATVMLRVTTAVMVTTAGFTLAGFGLTEGFTIITMVDTITTDTTSIVITAPVGTGAISPLSS